jgi:nucleotide-binding universal stress UspA family protein
MIKKIVCSTDFSKAANNATEYAAKLAQVLKAELLFINLQQVSPVESTMSMAGDIDENIKANALVAPHRLKEISAETNKMFNISTDYEVDITSQSLTKLIADVQPNNTLIVMGSNSTGDFTQYFFGTNTYNVIKKTNCPLLLVPENASYGNIHKIVFAWDYSSKSQFSFSLLADFMNAFNPQFIFIHVSKQPTEIGRDVFVALREEVLAVLGIKANVHFEQLFSNDIPEAINEYMIKSNADLLSLTFYNRGTLLDIFHGTVAKKISQNAEYPVLVLHA